MRSPAAGLALGLLLVARAATAAPPPEIPTTAIPTTGAPAPGPTQAGAAGFDQLTPMPSAVLTDTRGGAANVYAAISNAALSAVNSDNSVNAGVVNSGAVNLNAGAFSGFNGLGNFVINTGNNNNLQGALTVTINMAPAVGR